MAVLQGTAKLYEMMPRMNATVPPNTDKSLANVLSQQARSKWQTKATKHAIKAMEQRVTTPLLAFLQVLAKSTESEITAPDATLSAFAEAYVMGSEE